MRILMVGHFNDDLMTKVESILNNNDCVVGTNSIVNINNVNDFDVVLLNNNDVDSFLQERNKTIVVILNPRIEEPLRTDMAIHKKRKNKHWESPNKYHR